MSAEMIPAGLLGFTVGVAFTMFTAVRGWKAASRGWEATAKKWQKSAEMWEQVATTGRAS